MMEEVIIFYKLSNNSIKIVQGSTKEVQEEIQEEVREEVIIILQAV